MTLLTTIYFHLQSIVLWTFTSRSLTEISNKALSYCVYTLFLSFCLFVEDISAQSVVLLENQNHPQPTLF
jgi:hypothetical protein